MARVTGTFTGLGVSESLFIHGDFDVSISGTFVGTIELQRSFDGGVTWHATDIFTDPINEVAEIGGHHVAVRYECTAYTSGTIDFVFGK